MPVLCVKMYNNDAFETHNPHREIVQSIVETLPTKRGAEGEVQGKAISGGAACKWDTISGASQNMLESGVRQPQP